MANKDAQPYASVRRKLVRAYAQMASHTQDKCGADCEEERPHRCCDRIFCLNVEKFARQNWGVNLKFTRNKSAPLLGSAGCTAAPHLRPWCTIYVCRRAKFGKCIRDKKWDAKYRRLHSRILTLENELIQFKLKLLETGHEPHGPPLPCSSGPTRESNKGRCTSNSG